MQLQQIADNVYYIDAPVNMGVIVNDNGGALLVDTGLDDSAGRKVHRLLEANGLRLEGIIITHAHADHCGGAPRLVKATGARVYATAMEKTVLEFPIWEPVYLFAGACPPAPLQNKFFLAPGIKVDRVIEPGQQVVAGCEVEIVDLAGHTLAQAGVAAQGVLFCADAVIGPEVIDKHGVPLNADLAGALKTFDLLEGRRERYFLPAHGGLVGDIAPVVAANRSRVTETLECVGRLLGMPRSAEEILAGVCNNFNINITSMGQYYLMHLTVMAYLGYLYDRHEIVTEYGGNRQLFARA